ncbi:MAG: hypothetical protein WC994_01295 [Brumimicrobium sp.]
MAVIGIGAMQQTTNHKLVLPFYAYASIFIVVASLILFFNTDVASKNFYNQHTLSIVHSMALGWGTMMIFGASYQLLPVLIEGEIYSDFIGFLTFGFTGIGIPILIYGFYVFDYDLFLPIGAILINIGIITYLLNVFLSSFSSKRRNIHAWYIIIATVWLLTTTIYGLLLVFNFSYDIFPKDSWNYLTVHAHLGLIGWFLLLVIGVGSRLIPMFLISKYENLTMLRSILILINAALILFLLIFFYSDNQLLYLIPVAIGLIGVILFGIFIKKSHKVRIRKRVDQQVNTSLISVVMMLIPVIIVLLVLSILPISRFQNIAILYGFTILFGWITAMIFGMTYKTLPFIVWNKVYKDVAVKGRTLTPKDLFSDKIYGYMLKIYLLGFVVFIIGIIVSIEYILKIGAFFLLVAAILYLYNTSLTILHKPKKS